MKGIGLVELLVATAILAVVIAAGVSGLLNASATARAAAAALRQQERATYAMGTLEADLQMAGHFGVSAPGQSALLDQPPAAAHCGAELLPGLAQAVQVLPQYALTCAAAAGGAMPGTPVLVVRRAAAAVSSPAPGRWQWLGRADRPDLGELINDGMLPHGVRLEAGRVELRNLVIRAYYIARNSDSEAQVPSLRVKSLTSVAGRPAFIDTEVMPGVEDLQVSLLPSVAEVRTVQVRLAIRPEAAEQSAGRGSSQSFVRRFALRNLRAAQARAAAPGDAGG